MSTVEYTYEPNKWYNKRIRKNIDERRQRGKYYKSKWQNKAAKKKQFKKKETRKTRGENGIIIWNEWYNTCSDGDYSTHDHLIRSEYLPELAHSLLPYFDICFDSLGIDVHSRIDSKYNTVSYDAYLELVRPEMHFFANKEKFKPVLFEILRNMFYEDCLDILHCDNDHTLFLEMYQRFIYYQFECSCCPSSYCYHCKLCEDRKVYGIHYVWDIFCHDMKSYIYEIKLEIELIQLNDINIITQFNEMNSKQKWAQYISEMINIHGISTHLCFMILDFVSHEYPSFFWFTNNDQYSRYNQREESENYPTKEEAEQLIESRSCWLIQSSNWIMNIYGSSIGIYYYNDYDHGYFYRKSYDTVEYSANWLDLWKNIGNMSVQINCYKSMSDIINSQVIEGKSIEDIMEQKRKEIKKERIRLKKESLRPKLIAPQKQMKREDSFINMETRCSSTIPSEAERRKYDHKIRAERKYLTRKIMREIEERNNQYRIPDQKSIYKLECKMKKHKYYQMKLLRDKFRTLRKYANRYIVCYGYVHQFENEYNTCVEIIIPTDVIEIILHYIPV